MGESALSLSLSHTHTHKLTEGQLCPYYKEMAVKAQRADKI